MHTKLLNNRKTKIGQDSGETITYISIATYFYTFIFSNPDIDVFLKMFELTQKN